MAISLSTAKISLRNRFAFLGHFRFVCAIVFFPLTIRNVYSYASSGISECNLISGSLGFAKFSDASYILHCLFTDNSFGSVTCVSFLFGVEFRH